jgi:hypothetical protein
MEENRNKPTHLYSQLILNKGHQNTHWRKDSLSDKWCWENWIFICRRLKLNPNLSSCTKPNSRWIKDHNVRPEILKVLEENTGKTLQDIDKGNNILDSIQRHS